MLIEARQQLALVLPMWCLLWLAAGDVDRATDGRCRGSRFAASFVLQTHFTYAYQTRRGHGGGDVALRRPPSGRDLRRPDPTGSGRRRRGRRCAGRSRCGTRSPARGNAGERVRPERRLANGRSGHRRACASSPSRRSSRRSPLPARWATCSARARGPRWLVAVVALIGWTVVLARLGDRHAPPPPRPRGDGGGRSSRWPRRCYAAIKIPPTEQFGIIAQNYYWAWPVAVFLGHRRRRQRRAAARTAGSATASAASTNDVASLGDDGGHGVGTIPLLRPTNQLPETDHEWAVSRQLARPLIDQLGASLDEIDFDGAGARRPRGGPPRALHAAHRTAATRHRLPCSPPGRPTSRASGASAATTAPPGYLLTLRGGSGAVQLTRTDTLLGTVPGLTAGRRRAARPSSPTCSATHSATAR